MPKIPETGGTSHTVQVVDRSMNKHTLSVVIATHNEESFIGDCLQSVKDLADEILVADGESTDKTVTIAKSYGATVIPMTNKRMFHINKQKASEKATGEWILFLDADEIVSPQLAKQMREVINGSYAVPDMSQHPLFARHMANIESRDNVVFPTAEPITAYFIPRKNFFLGGYLMHSGVFPDGVIRLVRNGSAYWPCKDVHETMAITNGGVSWLTESLIHMADPTFKRYLERANRYTTLTAMNLQKEAIPIGFAPGIQYMIIKPCTVFLLLFLRHKGFLDGFSGFVWALMSGLHWPIAYMKYWEMSKKEKKQ